MKVDATEVKRKATMRGLVVQFTVTNRQHAEALDGFIGGLEGKVKVDITKPRKGRSLNANAYLWSLIGQIADKVGTTEKEVYRQLILDNGVYHRGVFENHEISEVVSVWEDNGLGYMALEESKDSRVTVLRLYAGSHTYDTKQFSKLLDSAIDEAKALGIPIKASEELEQLLLNYEGERNGGKRKRQERIS